MIFRKSKKNKDDGRNASPEISNPPAEETDQQPEVEMTQQQETEANSGYFRRLRDRLSKTRKTFSSGLDRIFAGKQRVDDELLEELEELLITSDIGVQTAMALMETVASSKIAAVDQIKSFLKDEILAILEPRTAEPEKALPAPRVIMIVGVNGTGKSTTIGKLAVAYDLMAPLKEFAQTRPIWGTCAGAIFISQDVRRDQPLLGLMDITVERNAFGRQVDSFETELDVPALAKVSTDNPPFSAVFIRAPLIESVNAENVEVLATVKEGLIVAAQQGKLLATSFHPELNDEDRFHQYFLSLVEG